MDSQKERGERMTREEREEAIERLENMDNVYNQLSDEDKEALEMAIEALSAEPCTDAVDRGTIIREMEKRHKNGDAITLGYIKNLPSVTPAIPTCEDAVSREAVLNIFNEWFSTCNIADKRESPKTKINALPPVIPKQRRGYWIPLGNYDDWGNESSYKCSECGDIDTYPNNYCPNCGAKMEGENE